MRNVISSSIAERRRGGAPALKHRLPSEMSFANRAELDKVDTGSRLARIKIAGTISGFGISVSGSGKQPTAARAYMISYKFLSYKTSST